MRPKRSTPPLALRSARGMIHPRGESALPTVLAATPLPDVTARSPWPASTLRQLEAVIDDVTTHTSNVRAVDASREWPR